VIGLSTADLNPSARGVPLPHGHRYPEADTALRDRLDAQHVAEPAW
jgi:hypothetical protein